MTKKQALAEAARRWGKEGCIEDRKRDSSPEARAKGSAELKEHRSKKPGPTPELSDTVRFPDDMPLGKFRRVRSAYIAEMAAWRARESSLVSDALHYRYVVGKANWAFHVLGSGDTWEMAFEAAAKRDV